MVTYHITMKIQRINKPSNSCDKKLTYRIDECHLISSKNEIVATLHLRCVKAHVSNTRITRIVCTRIGIDRLVSAASLRLVVRRVWHGRRQPVGHVRYTTVRIECVNFRYATSVWPRIVNG